MRHARAVLLPVLALTAAFCLQGGPARAEEGDDPCLCRDMIVSCTVAPKSTILGDPFEFCATVKSVGAVTLENVRLSIRGCPRAKELDGEQMTVVIPSLAQGQEYTHCVKFVCQDVGECQLTAHAVDSTGIAAAGCVCTAVCRGLPALQLEMIDTALDGSPKGIFRLGEEFLYVLRVENDVGSALTPDLRVDWTLPPELEFVRGRGDGGATVSGSGQSCNSSMFVLRPNQIQNFEVVCRVIQVPERNLVQTRAAVVTDQGSIELAVETESTTLKN
jgi:hypothetical protein